MFSPSSDRHLCYWTFRAEKHINFAPNIKENDFVPFKKADEFS